MMINVQNMTVSVIRAQPVVFGGGGQGGMNMDDIFSQFGDIFGGGGDGNPFESFFGGGGGRRREKGRGQRGSNLRVKVKMDLEEIANGAQKKIKSKKTHRL
jgi:molecular chaperone DnaJ